LFCRSGEIFQEHLTEQRSLQNISQYHIFIAVAKIQSTLSRELMAPLDISDRAAAEIETPKCVFKVNLLYFLTLVIFFNNPFSHNSYKDFTVPSNHLSSLPST